SIVSPQDGSVFLAPVDIRLAAAAADSDGWVTFVEFFDGTNSLGKVRNHPLAIDPAVAVDKADISPVPIDPIPLNLFVLVWSNVPPGLHVLTAVATDNDGAS